MLIALIIMIIVLVGVIAFSIRQTLQLWQVKNELANCYWQYQMYIDKINPLIRYLSRRHQEGGRITDDGLRTTFHMLEIDYNAWIDDVSNESL